MESKNSILGWKAQGSLVQRGRGVSGSKHPCDGTYVVKESLVIVVDRVKDTVCSA